MPHAEIQSAIERYLQARHVLLEIGRRYPGLIGGNDNIIGRIGEYIALRFLERRLGQRPVRVTGNANPGYDFVDADTQTQVKVITDENKEGRNVRLVEPWNQFVLIELGQHYRPVRIGIISKGQLQRACSENSGWSPTPIVKRTMLGPRGLIARYGRVYQAHELDV